MKPRRGRNDYKRYSYIAIFVFLVGLLLAIIFGIKTHNNDVTEPTINKDPKAGGELFGLFLGAILMFFSPYIYIYPQLIYNNRW